MPVSLATAASRAGRFRDDLSRHPIALDDLVLEMMASIGIAEFDRTKHDVAADRAVRAKGAGRNRVCWDDGTRRRKGAGDGCWRDR